MRQGPQAQRIAARAERAFQNAGVEMGTHPHASERKCGRRTVICQSGSACRRRQDCRDGRQENMASAIDDILSPVSETFMPSKLTSSRLLQALTNCRPPYRSRKCENAVDFAVSEIRDDLTGLAEAEVKLPATSLMQRPQTPSFRQDPRKDDACVAACIGSLASPHAQHRAGKAVVSPLDCCRRLWVLATRNPTMLPRPNGRAEKSARPSGRCPQW